MSDLTIKEILPDYYEKNGFDDDGGESNSYVKIQLIKGISMYLPNNSTRKKIILLHDIHHLLTQYSNLWMGEIQISAWELSTGCRSNWVAFSLNTYAMAFGTLFNLRGIWRAWVRGRNSGNLYKLNYSHEQLMDKTIEELKNELGLLNEPIHQAASFTTFLSFISIVIFSFIFSGLSVILIPFALLYSIFIALKN